jgi:hypothetical protein
MRQFSNRAYWKCGGLERTAGFMYGLVVIVIPVLLTGCASAPPPRTGFISDYSKLKKIDEGQMRYIAPQLRDYDAYIVAAVEMRAKNENIKPEQRAEVAKYMHSALIKVLTDGGYKIAAQPGPKVARLRVAITDIQEAKWYMNVHPGTKLTGAGRAGASMESEVVDSVTGVQLAAAIRSGKGKEFELNPFETINDVKNVIDQWAKSAGDRLKELRESKGNS